MTWVVRTENGEYVHSIVKNKVNTVAEISLHLAQRLSPKLAKRIALEVGGEAVPVKDVQPPPSNGPRIEKFEGREVISSSPLPTGETLVLCRYVGVEENGQRWAFTVEERRKGKRLQIGLPYGYEKVVENEDANQGV